MAEGNSNVADFEKKRKGISALLTNSLYVYLSNIEIVDDLQIVL